MPRSIVRPGSRSGSLPGLQARPGFSLVEILGVVILIGILGTLSFQSFGNATDRANNAKVAGNLHAVQQAVITFQGDNERFPNRLYPANANDETALLNRTLDRRYLPANRLPVAPWVVDYQNNNIDVTNPPTPPLPGFYRLDASAATATLKPVPAPNPTVKPDATAKNLMKRVTPTATGAAFSFTTYGAVLYETNTARNQYILHGIGKFKGSAAVVAIETNLN